MFLDKDFIKKIAKLARIDVTEEESKEFSEQLSDVLDYMEVLKKVDVSGVEETHQVTGLKNINSKDEVINPEISDDLIKCSDFPIEKNQIKVNKTI